MISPLTATLLELGDQTCKNLSVSHRLGAELSYGEETITETNLLSLMRNHSSTIHVRTFSKTVEAKNGSDWEWWIIGNKYSFAMRVQAKRINAKGQLKGLRRKSKTASRTQIDALIAGAKIGYHGKKLYPAYCLYYANEHRAKWKFPVPSSSGLVPYQTGCLIASAKRIERMKEPSAENVEDISVPWHFLFQTGIFARPDVLDIQLIDRPGDLTQFLVVHALSGDPRLVQEIMPDALPKGVSAHADQFFPRVDNLNNLDKADQSGDGWIEGITPEEAIEQPDCEEYPVRGRVVIDARSKKP